MFMFLKKKLALILSLGMILTLFAACGSGSGNSPAGDTSPAGDASPASQAEAETPAAPADDGQTYTLSVHQHDPATSATGKFLDAWAASIKEASNGRLDIQVYHGGTLGGPRDTVDMVLNGTVDIGWGLQSFFPGVFPKSEVVMLPMIGLDSAVQASNVMWDLYDNYDLLKDEYKDYHVLLLHANCSSPIASKSKNIQSVADMAGQNVRGNAGPPTNFIQDLGASPVGVPIGELYNAINNNTIDSVITDWHAIYSFKLYEQFKYYVDEYIGVSSYFMLMNQGSYDKLPADLQQILDEYSGWKALEIAGTFWDDIEAEVRGIIANDYPDTVPYKLSAEEHDKLQAVADKTAQNWIAATPDGQTLYDTTMELVSKYAQ